MGEVYLDDRRWRRLLNNIGEKVKNPYPLLRLGANTFGFQDIIDHFRQEKGPEGRWPRRKPSTQRAYKIRGKKDARYSPTNRLLQLTVNLRKSLIHGKTKKKGRNPWKL